MIKGLSRAGVGESGTIEKFVAGAGRYGFNAIDAGGSELREWAERVGVESARLFLKEHDVEIGAIGLPVEWRQEEERFRDGLVQLALDADIAARFGVTACCTYVLPSTDNNAAHFMALATRRLKACARILGLYGIRLGLEFVGPHHLRTQWSNPFIWTLDETLDWILAIGEPNVGLLLDSFHWYTTDGAEADILKLKPDQIIHVHLNDAKAGPVSVVLDNDRVYPGEGVIDLSAFLRALHVIGYKGAIVQEILTQQPPTDAFESLLERSKAGYGKAFRAAGLE